VIYHGDSRGALDTLRSIPALVLTDPPYGMDYKPVRSAPGSQTKWMRAAGIDSVAGDDEPFDPLPLLRFPRLVLFGANWYADKLPASGGWLVWDKTPRGAKQGFHASHAELAWTNCCSSVRKFALQWGGEARNSEPFLHPTQKPVGLMRWIVEMFTDPGDLVLDPYMGSGPVAQACKETGRGYLGFEIDERYVDAALSRLDQGTLFDAA
jgi:site-specific DNA-methyltransferase (adenine-specific)